MSEQAGFSVAAIQTRQAALVSQHGAAAEADRVLEELVAFRCSWSPNNVRSQQLLPAHANSIARKRRFWTACGRSTPALPVSGTPIALWISRRVNCREEPA